MSSSPGDLLRLVRSRAGLSQRELARRAGTAHSVVARIELGATSPSWETIRRLVEAAGFALDAEAVVPPVADSHMLADVDRILALSPEARLAELANLARFVSSARRA